MRLRLSLTLLAAILMLGLLGAGALLSPRSTNWWNVIAATTAVLVLVYIKRRFDRGLPRPDLLEAPYLGDDPGWPIFGVVRRPDLSRLEGLIRAQQPNLDRLLNDGTPAVRDWARYGEAVSHMLAQQIQQIQPDLDRGLLSAYPELAVTLPEQVARAGGLLSQGAWAAGRDYGRQNQADADRWRVDDSLTLAQVPAEWRAPLEDAIGYAYWVFGSVYDVYYESPAGQVGRSQRERHYRDVYAALSRAALYCFRAGMRWV